MVKKNKPTKDYTSCSLADENYDDHNPGVITVADSTLRATRPGEVQQVLGRPAAITPKPDSDEDASQRLLQRATAPADNAGRPAPETGSGARNMRNPSSPADNAGTEGCVPTTTTTTQGSGKPRMPSSKRRLCVSNPPVTDAKGPKTKPSAKKTSKKCELPTPASMGKHSTPINTTYGNSADADYGSDDPAVFDYENGGPRFVPRISGYLHPSFECWVYLTIAQRMGRARQLGCCFRCLGQGHESSSCPEKANNTCLLCGTGEHHEAFCRRSADSCEDHEDHHVEDLLSDRFQVTLYNTELEADKPTAEPTPRPADNAGTEGGTNTVEADNATTCAGTTGKAVEVLSIPPPPPGAPRNDPFEQLTWTQELRNAECGYHGYVNAYTVPWAYLPPEAYVHQTLRNVHYQLGDLTLDDVIKEDERLPRTQAASRQAQPASPSRSMRCICAFCQSPHWSLKCTVYVSRNQRLRRAEKLKLCFACLKEGHHSNRCPRALDPCKFCLQATHHRALCRSGATNNRRATKLPTNDLADGTNNGKKRVSTAQRRVTNPNHRPAKNETICFCDALRFTNSAGSCVPEF
ncbi:Pao retrotransposon peptidase family protein [Aphelenchoides avenae]|nr:Pao retrotransposon peptidase family protein [Aphelenchus avenae]